MPDRSGVTLTPGDAVLYHHDEEAALGATVLVDNDNGTYLIQLDQRKPSPPGQAERDPEIANLTAAARQITGIPRMNHQEPFTVPGSQLALLWDAEEDDLGDDEDLLP